ncbi:hypothetical protein B0T25DRAFT_576781 [Lasiosphaeria hispida]|uniref:Uncharacterized protein n=1 Tax=Lasiosphaeria hispida TaxID=260671 RepID=A0AAJ0HXL1_9PEZI|nr:hypothetical protein B0T25DRAFT_576781 [Lasiosphaeria hispida]
MCSNQGNPDMYGLGIRVAFYLLWYGNIAAPWYAKSTLPNLRLVLSFFIAGSFLGLIIQTSLATIRAVDVYVTLLLTYGTYYYLVPVFVWRLVVVCTPFRDPSRWPRVPPTTLFKRLDLILMIAVTCFQMWFWTAGVNSLQREPGCQEYGFFFSQVPLNAALFVAWNVVVMIGLLLCAVVVLTANWGCLAQPRWVRKQDRRFEKELDRLDRRGEEYIWRRELQVAKATSDLTVASVLVAAIELTVQWNNLSDANWVSTTAQTVPLIVAAGLVVHSWYVWVNPYHDVEITDVIEADTSETISSTDTSRSLRPKGGRGPSGGVARPPGVHIVG